MTKDDHIRRAVTAATRAVDATSDDTAKSLAPLLQHGDVPAQLHRACADLLMSLAAAERSWQAGVAELAAGAEAARKALLHAFLAMLATTAAEAEICADNAEACATARAA